MDLDVEDLNIKYNMEKGWIISGNLLFGWDVIPMNGKHFLRLINIIMITVMIVLSFVTAVAAAKPNHDVERPTVGLALGGGSAKGFAHIGVLIWLEEHRIPVDYIAGTSMGGLVGGCYAMGMSPQEISELVQSIDWAQVFNLYAPYETLDYRRKEDRRDYPVHSMVGLKNGRFQLPNGLFSYQVDLIISRITLPYSIVDDFNDLPILFHCVATDVRNAQAVVMDHGSFATALRSTMSLPGIFNPVPLGDRLLVDGGLLNNVPADVVKDMGADIVIAVDVTAEEEISDKNDLGSVLMQSMSAVTKENSRRASRFAELVLKPRIGKLNGFDWGKSAEFIKLGYQAAEAHGDLLRTLALDEAAWMRYLQDRQQRRPAPLPAPSRIEVTGTNPVNRDRIKTRLKWQVGRPLDLARLEEDMHEIYGSCLYDTLSYELQYDNNTPVLLIKAVEKSYGPPFIDLAMIVQSDGYHADYVNINARSRITSYNVWGKQTELRTDLGFGTELYFMSEFYRPFYNSRWFIAPSVCHEQNNSNLYEDGQRVTDYRVVHSGGGVDLGYTHEKNYEFRLGYFWRHQKARIRVGRPFGTDVDGKISLARFLWQYNNVDDPVLPRKGLEAKLNLVWYQDAPGADDEFSMAEGKVAFHIPVGARDSAFIMVEAGKTLEGHPPLIQQFKLGGPFRMGTYRVDEFCGENFLLSSIGYIKNIGPLVVSGTDFYIGFWLEHGGIAQEWNDLEPETNISLGLFNKAFFGPVYVGASYGEGDNPWLHFAIGKVF